MMLITSFLPFMVYFSHFFWPAIIGGFLLLLIIVLYPFYHRKKHQPIIDDTQEVKVNPNEWEQKMQELANEQKHVRWMKYNFVVSRSNQKAYQRINSIRSIIENTPPEIISLIPSAQWLFDNFQIIYREIKKVKTTGTSYLELPILQSGVNKGYPRMYVIAQKMVKMSEGYLQEDTIAMMIHAYQKVTILNSRELQVLTEMLGLCILERVIEVAQNIVKKVQLKIKASQLVQKRVYEHVNVIDISGLLTPSAYIYPDNISFHSHILYRLKNMAVEAETLQAYLQYHLPNSLGIQQPSELFVLEGRLEVALESKIRTLILSLLEMNKLDGELLFEQLSQIEAILMKDPDNIYSNMDSDSRGMYRQVVEKLAFRYKIAEDKVALMVLALAKEGNPCVRYPHHVGSYLINEGQAILKARIRSKNPPKHLSKRLIQKMRFLIYFGMSNFFFAVLHFIFYLVISQIQGILLLPIWLGLSLLLWPFSLELALKMTNDILTRILPVHRIPAMDYRLGVPDGARTFLTIPVIVDSKEQGLEYLKRLHVRYLANPQSNIYYALLVDYADSNLPDLAVDEDIKHALIKHIDILNEKHPSKYRLFSLFIRSRQWNEKENRYMAWERKRGKMEEFMALLNGIELKQTSFSTVLCDEILLKTSKYVISLDADSNLTKDNATKLIGSMDHPLNRAVLNTKQTKVIEGYAIIQPSVKNHIIDQSSSAFPKIFSGQTGLANYPMTTSDIYQDVFQEGSFVGKGIYNARVIHQLLYHKIPENRVLSHDLLESCYARTAFVSTIDIVENFPGNYLAYLKREHRWIRGDWQLIPWIIKSRMGLLSRWKMLDNLRASLASISLLIFIIITPWLIPSQPYLWLYIFFLTSGLETLILTGGILQHKLRRPKLAIIFRKLRLEIRTLWQRIFLSLLFLPTRAFNAVDAISRTLFRLLISGKNMLEWSTSDSVEKKAKNTLTSYWLNMLANTIAGVILLVLLVIFPLKSMWVILYVVLATMWILAFILAYNISQPKQTNYDLDQQEETYRLLKDTARRMWLFFDTFSTKETNYLCPDNYQIATTPKLAYRTSPTNIGLQFLALLSSRDFGFQGLTSLLESVENLLYTVSCLPKWQGHLYNWYDIQNLELLYPHYVSTVDSGNFLSSMIALKQGLLQQMNQPVIHPHVIKEIQEQAELLQIEASVKDHYQDIQDLDNDLDIIMIAIAYCPSVHKSNLQALNRLVLDLKQEIIRFQFKENKLPFEVTLKQLHKAKNEQANRLVLRIEGLVEIIDNMLKNADFSPLFDTKRYLFHIGYNASSQRLDNSYYDLIASESLMTSLLAIARNDVPIKHWRRLGRPQALVKGIPTHIAWSGTMFEYLMPNLLLHYQEGSVFYDSVKGAVIQQKKYAHEKKIPWGISESQHNQFDLDSNYQYQAFGIPKLRLQPFYTHSLVVSPYSTMLALDYCPQDAIDNLNRLKQMGAYGEYGFYEALDFHAPDPAALTPYCVVKSFMAHHQGMSLVAINNFLHQGIMRQRFHAEEMIKASEFLLEEKLQTYLISISRRGYTVSAKQTYGWENTFYSLRQTKEVNPNIVKVNYLSNNHYSLLLTSDGDGFSEFKNRRLYRWKPDTVEPVGSYIYLKDITNNHLWSATYHPTKVKPDDYQVIFSHHKSEFKRLDHDIETTTLVTLALEHDLEIRSLRIKNNSKQPKMMEITSYMEVVASSYAADKSHPAFSKLFIESEYLAEYDIFLSKRRSDTPLEQPYIFHFIKSKAKPLKKFEYENDRLRFVGRNQSLAAPQAVVLNQPLANSCAFSTDPIMSIRASYLLEEEASLQLVFYTGVCQSKEEAIQIWHEFSLFYRLQDVMEKYRQQSLMEMKYLNISGSQLDAIQNLIAPIFYPSRHYKAAIEHTLRNTLNQSGLWRFGISGDVPILLIKVTSMEQASLVKEVVQAYQYMRLNQLKIDLVILSEAPYGYLHELDDLLNHLTRSLKIFEERQRPSFFIVHAYQMNQQELDLLLTVASIVFSKDSGIYFRHTRSVTMQEEGSDKHEG